MDIIEAQENLLKYLEKISYKYNLDPYSDDGFEYCCRLPEIYYCCRLIGIDNDVISENEDVGKQRAINKLKEIYGD